MPDNEIACDSMQISRPAVFALLARNELAEAIYSCGYRLHAQDVKFHGRDGHAVGGVRGLFGQVYSFETGEVQALSKLQ